MWSYYNMNNTNDINGEIIQYLAGTLEPSIGGHMNQLTYNTHINHNIVVCWDIVSLVWND